MSIPGPKDWSPHWKTQAPWAKFGHEEYDYEDDLSWLTDEAAGEGLWSRIFTRGKEGEGGPSYYRFDGKKFLDSVSKMAKARAYPLTEDQLQPLRNAVGAILTEERNEPKKVEVYWSLSAFQSDWADLKERRPKRR